jgi:hypothetical protein
MHAGTHPSQRVGVFMKLCCAASNVAVVLPYPAEVSTQLGLSTHPFNRLCSKLQVYLHTVQWWHLLV